jgi:nucleotidyltransferase AbiEii toxin of type IV toxin-antitoxin system
MNKIATTSERERGQLFTETAVQRGLSLAVIEKDFWICWILEKLFSCPDISKQIIFKGGTSLSKVYNLIERFSEDIDLILDWREVTNENPRDNRSKSKQDKFNKTVNIEAANYLKANLFPRISRLLEPVCKTMLAEDNSHALRVLFPVLSGSSYLRPEILLEVGPLGAWTPHEKHTVSSYVADEFPQAFKNTNFDVKVTTVERTFWEKITILHHEAHRPAGSNMPTRYSRHYYDVYCMAHSAVKNSALADLKLLKTVVDFKKKFYPRGWARYDLAKLGSVKLMPPVHVIGILRQDYAQMKEMIYGDYPSFKDIMSSIKQLEDDINKVRIL